jgi:thiosulfate/3-mercaptopyruvate sulfurtransferase
MPLTLTRWFSYLAAACVLLAMTMTPATAEDDRRGRLVSVSWLQKQLADVVLLDASFMHQHKNGHIPGAISANNYGGQEPSHAAMEKRIQTWGINPGRKIVIYDKGADWSAARLFHDLYYYGIPAEDIFILDGGFSKWQQQGGAVSKEPTPAPTLGTFRIAKVREEARVRLPEFLVASGDKTSNALVDALDPEYYYGEDKFFTRAGHIPNATLMPVSDFFNSDKTFKSPDEIRRMASYLGIKPDQQVLSHCGGGGAASVPWFAFQFLAEYPKVKMYWESQREWLRDDRELPFWTYTKPQLQRDSSWLDGWNAPMLRAFGVAQVNIVDVRPADKYAQGHVPYAINIPAETFRNHLGRPAQLAELLGPAGVNSAHEVVIMSGAGLTPSAALTFLTFELLGQKKISILMDTVDEWGARGHKLTTAPTIVGSPKAPADITVPVATFTSNPGSAVVTSDIKGTMGINGAYPTILVSSGIRSSALKSDGKTVHLPYTELLTTDGQPKAAKDLWKLISKAGVPRHAQVIFYADDVADAAVNYYVFQLMGWPDIKVLVN